MSADYIPFDREFAKEFSLQVDVGNASAPDGITRVRLDGAGNLAAAQYRPAPLYVADADAGKAPRADDRTSSAAETSEEVKGEMSAEDAGRIFEQVSLVAWDARFPTRPGIPDEAIVEIRLQRDRGESATRKMWLRDAEKDVAMGPVLAQLRRRVGALSEGRIYL